jgi:hypothetical protein
VSETTAWGRWDCTRCGQKDISGRDKRCPSCGDPREQHELDAMRPPDESEFATAAITAPDELELAKSGPDWICGFCGTTNRGTATSCESCNGARDEATALGKVGELGSEVAPKLPGKPGRAEPPIAELLPKRRSIKKWVLLGLAVMSFLLWCGFRDHDEEGEVVALRWKHTTLLQRWQDVSRGAWAPVSNSQQVPPVLGQGEVAGRSITGCHQKHHHDESYACGTESYNDSESYSCGSTQSCSTSRNGNGSFTRSCTSRPKTCYRTVRKTRTKYCSRPIYREWCDFITQEWVTKDSKVVSGEGHETHFAEIPPSGDLERNQRSGEYQVVVMYDEDKAHVATVERPEYDSWQKGERVILSVEGFGAVTGMRRPDKK